MIRVNLLPAEYRKVESTSLSLFLLFLTGVIVLAVTFVIWLMMKWNGNGIAEDLNSKKLSLQKFKEEASEAALLEEELDQYNKRQETIMAIRASRIYWSKKLEQLVNDTRKEVWFTSIKVNQKDALKIKTGTTPSASADGGSLDIDCYQKTADSKIFAGYQVALQQDRIFSADFAKSPNPGFQKVVWDGVVDEDKETLSFRVPLFLKPQIIFSDVKDVKKK